MKELKPFIVKLEGKKERQHLLGDFPKTAGLRSGQVILKAGEAIGEHSTKGREEVIIVLEGQAEISSDKGPSFIAKRDTLVYMPPYTTHNVKNIGMELLRYVYIVSPSSEKGD